MPVPVVFINIGWMKRYEGHTKADPLRAKNFGYFKKHNVSESEGHEQWNFKPRNGVVHGYVPRSASININRLGAATTQTELGGVLVVFIARDPIAHELKVVGWYRNATVARHAIFVRQHGTLKVEAPIKATDWHIVPVADRDHTLVVPTAHKETGGVGQSPIWYADSHPALVSRIRALAIHGISPAASKVKASQTQPSRSSNVKNRLEIERRSMEWALRYFDDAEDVSKACKGWDIEAKGGHGRIYVEVKGTSGPVPAFELTPNEYAMLRRHKKRYLVFVVTGALSKRPAARTFTHDPAINKPDGAWVSERGEVLILEDRVGARARI